MAKSNSMINPIENAYAINKTRLIARFKTPQAIEIFKAAKNNAALQVNKLHFFERGTKYDGLSPTEQNLYNTVLISAKGKPVTLEKTYSNLKGDPTVAYVQYDQRYELFTTPDQNLAINEWWFSAINCKDALKAYNVNNKHIVKVAVIDTGIDHLFKAKPGGSAYIGHPDLDPTSFESTINRRDFRSLEWDDKGLEILNKEGNTIHMYSDGDLEVHGTHVAGIIGALLNNTHTVGIAHKSLLMNLRAFPDATDISLTLAIRYAVNNAYEKINKIEKIGEKEIFVRVINASWGSKIDYDQNPTVGNALKDAITDACSKGIVFVCAAGNGTNENGLDVKDFVPSNFDNVITVGSVYPSPDDPTKIIRADSSNYGKKVLGAPGVKIASLYADHDNQMLDQSGTSMATAFVSGLVARMLNKQPTLLDSVAPNQVVDKILNKIKRLPIQSSPNDIIDPNRPIDSNNLKAIGLGMIDVDETLNNL